MVRDVDKKSFKKKFKEIVEDALAALVIFGLTIYINYNNFDKQAKHQEQTILNNLKRNPNISPKDAAKLLNGVYQFKYKKNPITGQETLVLIPIENNSK